ncbi:ABC transporter substrate-binding protein [Granulibacter bethesdensis]|uniref:ABC transporter substrate-binding protein n=1 Tax=Granulibacter bethesdensis TaxID=364410 RepID=A0AAN0RF18_9PROT|nr:ABC transporter substrate-binding protein [Granulibacter bethesdensis]AHJ63683.1 ABC transporter substrate-binding protein [Granulibacter bethesdensis]AHJ65736.1 ABC transporter substrate-binding protein [Granulibacter bethesdensis CGDNIH4]
MKPRFAGIIVAGVAAIMTLVTYGAGAQEKRDTSPSVLGVGFLPGVNQDFLRKNMLVDLEARTHLKLRFFQWNGDVDTLGHLDGPADSVLEWPEAALDAACEHGLVMPLAKVLDNSDPHHAATGEAEQGNTHAAPAPLSTISPDTAKPSATAGNPQRNPVPHKSTAAGIDWLPQGQGKCGLGAWMRSMVLVWDVSKFQSVEGWSDFWDIAKYPGKRGLHRGAEGNLEIALMADGVSPGDVYNVLSGKDGQDRAFRKLAQLRPYIVWWETDAQAVHLMASGQVLMESAPAERIFLADREAETGAPSATGKTLRYGVQWSGNLYRIGWWAAPSGANPLMVQDFLRTWAGKEVQQAMAGQTGLGTFSPEALAGLSPQIIRWMPTADNHWQKGLKIDAAFWAKNGAMLNERLNQLMK